MHVRGYKEKGNIDTPLELAIRNEVDRFSLAILAIDLVSEAGTLGNKGASAREMLKEEQMRGKAYAYETGEDPEGWTNWTWPEDLKPPHLQRDMQGSPGDGAGVD